MSASGEITGTPTLAGTYTPVFGVQNSSGSTASKRLEILIKPNVPPVIDSTEPPEGMVSMDENTSREFSVTAHDPYDRPLSYQWELNGEPVGDGATDYTLVTDWGDAGDYDLRCYVSNESWTNPVYAAWNITVSASPPSTLTGRVSGAGVPLEDAVIELRGTDGEVYDRVHTDASGHYTLTPVASGYYHIKVDAQGFAAVWHGNANHFDQAELLMVPAGLLIGGLDFDLVPGQSPALVKVTSDPAGADIYLDYWPTGEVTPATLKVGEVGDWDWAGYQLAPHVITVQKSGHPRPAPQTVSAKEAESVSVSFDMTSSATGTLSVTTIPAGAEVYVNSAEAPAGVTPVLVADLAPGQHTVLLRKVGCLQPRPVQVDVLENVTTDIEVVLTSAQEAESEMLAEVKSVPAGVRVYVNYLPTDQHTDAVVGSMDPSLENLSSSRDEAASLKPHTLLLRRAGLPPIAPRYVPEEADTAHPILIHLSVDPAGATDSNGDGIPDWLWEQHGYDPGNPPDVNAIADASGMTFGDKLRAGLIPEDPLSRLGMGDVDITDDPETGRTIVFVFDTIPGRRYLLQARERLTEGDWTNISGLISATSYQTVFSAHIPPEMENHFYRLVVLVP